MKNQIQLRPTYWASVSGGKDSLFMLSLILNKPDKYPLNGVVHFELEIDYPFVRDVVDYMETECKKRNIPFVRIKPRRSWYDLYGQYGFPTRKARWCNSKYKLDAKQQLQEYMKSVGYNVIHYIGYCADEYKRFDKRKNSNEIYPLVDFGINEKSILEWAKTQPIFNNYYLTNTRCGCMFCPISNRLNFAYLFKYYHSEYNKMLSMMIETEQRRERELGRPFSIISSNPKYNAVYLDNNIRYKWLAKLNQLESEVNQQCPTK